MVVKESLQAVEEEYTDFQQDPYEEEEEALSLCDLPIHDDSFKWEDESFSNKLHHETRSSFGNDDFFEFFSEDFIDSAYSNPSGKDIIFCGKLIPYEEPPLLPSPPHHHHHQHQQQTQNHHHHHHHQQQKTSKKPTENKGFQWKHYSFHKLVIKSSSKNGENSSCSKPQKALSLPNKSRWPYLFMFGVARLPTEMELRDIKTRQSRRIPSATMFSSFEEEIVKEKVVRRKRSRAKGLWGLIRALGCSSSLYSNVVVKDSFGCNVPEERG